MRYQAGVRGHHRSLIYLGGKKKKITRYGRVKTWMEKNYSCFLMNRKVRSFSVPFFAFWQWRFSIASCQLWGEWISVPRWIRSICAKIAARIDQTKNAGWYTASRSPWLIRVRLGRSRVTQGVYISQVRKDIPEPRSGSFCPSASYTSGLGALYIEDETRYTHRRNNTKLTLPISFMDHQRQNLDSLIYINYNRKRD